jgi:hypothetical protein
MSSRSGRSGPSGSLSTHKPEVRPISSHLVPDEALSHLVPSSPPPVGGTRGTRGTRVGEGEREKEAISSQESGTNLETVSGLVIPCPQCGVVQYMAGPDGLPRRRCWGCDHIFVPDIEAVLEAENAPARPIEYRSASTITELVEGLAAGKPLKLTTPTVRPRASMRQWTRDPSVLGRKRCPDGHQCEHEPSGDFTCCDDPSEGCQCSACRGGVKAQGATRS